ncbi:cyclic pyranopterin monophosphate synthase MoaC [Microbacterium sp. SORGH_AS_0888]|uniref:cyclic pyranopterin monophosphate synthase MoaC n=1 Tax=Microbacterium sp. SORGH_AS_0888 TaxID=3041791 RepID=UPI0027851E44|nr:cyclic pyranopterin monophosphate synthase MoaC [Microbacterium sp. SORGH_AS_0888]MDQ1128609.1 cyclic pyranopterin phosphate synthase [Microbacterium sp. SORGH_AS_0888]
MAENADRLTHLRPDGAAHMVDVADKDVTRRRGVAVATLRTRPDVIRLIADGTLPKGEAIGTARLAGIMAAKATSTLIPLCHPLAITSVDVVLTVGPDRVDIVATVSTLGRTGVEMEALTAASVAGLTLYDMIKAVDRAARITDIAVIEKDGGRSGHWVQE